MAMLELTGKRFGMLVCLRYVSTTASGYAKWLCKCDCGAETIRTSQTLTMKKSESCGCIRRKKVGEQHTTHGLSGSPEYAVWRGIRRRCSTAQCEEFKNYGGRGIKVCDAWRDFGVFIKDMGRRPSENHSIDRVDNDGNYDPSNCKWVTSKEQARNMRKNKWIEFKGETLILADWGARFSISPQVLNRRLSLGWPMEKALTKTTRPKIKSGCANSAALPERMK